MDSQGSPVLPTASPQVVLDMEVAFARCKYLQLPIPKPFRCSLIMSSAFEHHITSLSLRSTARPGSRLYYRLYDCAVLRAFVAVVPVLDQVCARHAGTRAQRGRTRTG